MLVWDSDKVPLNWCEHCRSSQLLLITLISEPSATKHEQQIDLLLDRCLTPERGRAAFQPPPVMLYEPLVAPHDPSPSPQNKLGQVVIPSAGEPPHAVRGRTRLAVLDTETGSSPTYPPQPLPLVP